MTNDFVLISTKNTKEIPFGVTYWKPNLLPNHSSDFIEKEAQFQVVIQVTSNLEEPAILSMKVDREDCGVGLQNELGKKFLPR